MYHRVVLTAGTSAFAPGNLGLWAREQKIFEIQGRDFKIPEGISEEEAFQQWAIAFHQAPLADQSRERISAEISALNALQKMSRLGKKPHITLIHTQTLDGRAAAELVAFAAQELYREAQVELRSVELDANRPQGMRAGLGAFMQEVARALEAGEQRTTCFIPIGGYKVMTSLGYLAGAYLGYSTTYLHEDQQRLHIVPPVPIQIDEEALKPLASLIRRVVWASPPLEDFNDEERQAFEEHPHIFYEFEPGHIGLSPFGEFLRERPRLRPFIGPQVYVSKDLLELCKRESMSISELIKDLLNAQRSEGRYRETLYHERGWIDDADFHLYKKRRSTIRFAWRYEETLDRLYLKKIWLKEYDTYKRDVDNGALKNEPNEWLDLTELLSSP